jgi:thiamine pyrophosphate-dependent acetolactate synthase large subunit-like protein
MNKHNELARRSAIARILANRGDMLVVTGLGSPTYDCAAVGDHSLNFYLWGAMGSAVTVGLGLALAQPKRRVLVITGDGEMLMGLGGLATAAVKRPDNLAILVIDNEHYGETGIATHSHRYGGGPGGRRPRVRLPPNRDHKRSGRTRRCGTGVARSQRPGSRCPEGFGHSRPACAAAVGRSIP